MTIIAIGPHPDDPEEGAGGTLARIARAGERIIIVYMTSGGKGIYGKAPEDAIAIREQEARDACKILSAEPVFIGLTDGACFPDENAINQLQELFQQEQPKLVLTCWPLDTHGDHRATGYMATEAFCRAFGSNFDATMRDPLDLAESVDQKQKKFPGLFYWATELWHQSVEFRPTVLIDINSTIDTKMELVEAHVSQNRGDNLVKWVEKDATELGNQYGGPMRYVEGFIGPRPGLI